MYHYRLPYGTSELKFALPWRADLAESQQLKIAPPQQHSLIPDRLDLRGDDQALIVFTDATRHSPDQWLAEAILAKLPLPPHKIRFLCALGMHRPSTPEEKLAKLGPAILAQHEVLDHDPAKVITLGQIEGIPVEVNPLLVEPGTFLILMGVVEPHQYAGYSGGAKTAVIGCGGPQTIAQTHGVTMLDHPGVRLGAIEGNPFQDFVRQAGQKIGVDLVANVVMPQAITHAAIGGPEVHDKLIAAARALYETPVPHAPYDLILAGVGSPKDANLYQASRAPTYLGLCRRPVLRPGGVMIIPATMPEGPGQGEGETNFFRLLRRFGPTPALIDHLHRHKNLPGEQRAYMLAQLLAQYHCIFVGVENPDFLAEAGLLHAPTMPEALAMAQTYLGPTPPKTLLVPHALKTLPSY